MQAIFQSLESIHNNIIQWYIYHGRKLPWREAKHYATYAQWQQSLQSSMHLLKCDDINTTQQDSTIPNICIYHYNTSKSVFNHSRAYRVWISEVMLQQTQVMRVLESYYFQFLAKFPTLYALGTANMADILKAWQGLGYYNRVRNIHKSALYCMEHYNAKLPQDIYALRNLYGIGNYTAGAIACFGFGQSVGFVDANIRRLLLRFFGIESMNEQALIKLATQFLNPQESFLHNQALIDLGATICTHELAKCDICVLMPYCKGKSQYKRYGIKQKKPSEQLTLILCVFTISMQNTTGILCTKYTGKRYQNLFSLLEWRDSIYALHTTYTHVYHIGNFKHTFTRYRLSVSLYHIVLEEFKELDSMRYIYAPLGDMPLQKEQIEIHGYTTLYAMAHSNLTHKALKLYESNNIFTRNTP